MLEDAEGFSGAITYEYYSMIKTVVKVKENWLMANYCKMCGTKLDTGIKFCMKCGAPVQNQFGGIKQMSEQRPEIQEPQAVIYQKYGRNSSDDSMKIALMIILVLLIGAGGYYFYTESAARDVVTSSVVDRPVDDNTNVVSKKNQSGAVSAAKGDSLDEFVREKDAIDTEIGETANRINTYLASHSGFQGYDGIKNDVRNLVDRASKARVQLNSICAADVEKKQALVELFSLEEDRARGLYKGIVDNQNGGDYSYGFQQGTQASYAFDSANIKFNANFR